MPPRAPSARPAYPRADPRAGDGVGLANRCGGTDRLCETLSSWRLLVGGLSPGASHHSFTTSSEEPPLSNFNSYRDIPQVPAVLVTVPNGAYSYRDWIAPVSSVTSRMLVR